MNMEYHTGPQITCVGCQGERGRGKFRADIGTWVCDACYAEMPDDFTDRADTGDRKEKG